MFRSRRLVFDQELAELTGDELRVLLEHHGGVIAVHTEQYQDGWANTLVCKDGWTYTGTAAQDHELSQVFIQ